MTQPDEVAARPGWVGRTPGYGLAPSRNPLPAPRTYTAPPRWGLHSTCALLALYLGWQASTPTPSVFGCLMATAALVFCAAVWIIWLLVVLRERGPIGPWWALAPLGGVLTVALLLADAPLNARFALADGELSGVARSVLAAPDPAASAKAIGDLGQVGTYRVKRVEARDGVAFFNFGASDGMAYVPDGVAAPAETPYVLHLDHLRGPWYTWSAGLND